MVMDWVRSCYTAPMRFGPNGPVVRVRWFFAAPNAKDFPGHHVFGSLNYAREKRDYEGLGEFTFKDRVWDRGERPPGMDGQHFCGTPLQFEGALTGNEPGLPVGPAGVPFCCIGPGYGGVLLDGQAAIDLGRRIVARGGVLLDGSADFSYGNRIIARGGVEADGSADFVHGRAIAGAGGLLLDGSGIKSRVITGAGGLEANGSAELVRVACITGSGGLQADGMIGQPMQTACCPDPLPSTLLASLSVIEGGGCECADGLSTPLEYNAAGRWVGSLDLGPTCMGGVLHLEFYCSVSMEGTANEMRLEISGCAPSQTLTPDFASCESSMWSFPAELGSGCCPAGGDTTVTIFVHPEGLIL